MKKNRKKVMSIVLAMTMVIGMFAGCGKKEVPETTEAPVETTEATTEALVSVLTVDKETIELGYGSVLIFKTDENDKGSAAEETTEAPSTETATEAESETAAENAEENEAEVKKYEVAVHTENVKEWGFTVEEVNEDAADTTDAETEDATEAETETADKETVSSYNISENEVTFNVPGTYKVVVTAAGEDGTELNAEVVVTVVDDVAPVLEVPEEISFQAGKKYDWMKDVTAADEIDGDITENVAVDDSEVDREKTGEYVVKYSVTDKAGNTIEAEVAVTVTKKKTESSGGSAPTNNESSSNGNNGRDYYGEAIYVIDNRETKFEIEYTWGRIKDQVQANISAEKFKELEAYVNSKIDAAPDGSVQTPSGDNNTPSSPSGTIDRGMGEAAFAAQNQKRTEAGVPALEWNEDAYELCCRRVQEIQSNFSHDGCSGDYGENIATGYGSADSVIQAWMESEGHRNNILKERYTYGAIAYMNGYWVAVFHY